MNTKTDTKKDTELAKENQKANPDKKEKLNSYFADLKKAHGIDIDERRSLASLSLSGKIMSALESDKRDASGDAIEEDENYFYVTFRALSMTVFPWRGLCLDFSREGVLKRAVKFLKNQTVYTDHDTRATNWKGVVVATRFDESVDIPQGINARLRLNKKWSAQEIDGIKDGALHSASTGVFFEFEKSHASLEDFWYHMGEEINGEIVRLIVTKIISFDEISLVWQGADVFAKKLSLEGNGDKGSKPDGDNQKNETNLKTKTKQKLGGKRIMKLSLKLAKLFGLSLAFFGLSTAVPEVELDESQEKEALSKMEGAFSTLKELFEKQEKAIAVLFGEDPKFDLATLAQEMKTKADAGEAHLKSVRDEALTFAKLCEGEGKLSEAMEKAITNAGLEDAQKFLEDFQKKAELKFPAKCAKCGGSVSRASAEKGKETPANGTEINEKNYEM